MGGRIEKGDGVEGKGSEGDTAYLLCNVELPLLVVLVSMGAACVQLLHIEMSTGTHLLQHADHQAIRHGHIRPIKMLPELPHFQ